MKKEKTIAENAAIIKKANLHLASMRKAADSLTDFEAGLAIIAEDCLYRLYRSLEDRADTPEYP